MATKNSSKAQNAGLKRAAKDLKADTAAGQRMVDNVRVPRTGGKSKR